MTKYLKITIKELGALIETADSCAAMSNDDDMGREARAATKAYQTVLKRELQLIRIKQF
jgi:hypothetical protein